MCVFHKRIKSFQVNIRKTNYSIYDRFRVSLENPSVNLSAVREEWDDMVDYSNKYLNLVELDYKVIWWKIFNLPLSEWNATGPLDVWLRKKKQRVNQSASTS